MNVLYYVITGLHILFCLFLILVVLLQQGKGQDLASAFGGGGSQTAFGPRGSATVLSRATAIAAGLFMVTSLTLSIVRPKEASLLDQVPALAPSATETTPEPEAVMPPVGDALESSSEAPPEAAPPDASPAADPGSGEPPVEGDDSDQ
jgi:preprotein translocase subunit SecG